MTICPICLMRGLRSIHVRGKGWIDIQCEWCEGSGHVRAEALEWIERGKRLKEARLRENKSLRAKAEELGVSVMELSDAECGKVDNSEMNWLNKESPCDE